MCTMGADASDCTSDDLCLPLLLVDVHVGVRVGLKRPSCVIAPCPLGSMFLNISKKGYAGSAEQGQHLPVFVSETGRSVF